MNGYGNEDVTPFAHLTLPGLPERLWPAAALLDSILAAWSCSDEVRARERESEVECGHVVRYRKAFLGW